MPTSWTTDSPDTTVSWHADDVFPYVYSHEDEAGYLATPYSGAQQDGNTNFRRTVSGWTIDSSAASRCSMSLTQEDLGAALPASANFVDQPFGKILITNTGGGIEPTIDFTIYSTKYKVFDIDIGKPHYMQTTIGKESGTGVSVTSSCEYFGGADVFGNVTAMASGGVFNVIIKKFKPTTAGALKWKMRFYQESPGTLWASKQINLYSFIFGRTENISNAINWDDD